MTGRLASIISVLAATLTLATAQTSAPLREQMLLERGWRFSVGTPQLRGGVFRDSAYYLNDGASNTLVVEVNAISFEVCFFEGAAICRHVRLVKTFHYHAVNGSLPNSRRVFMKDMYNQQDHACVGTDIPQILLN
jgi:hypothetical protein